MAPLPCNLCISTNRLGENNRNKNARPLRVWCNNTTIYSQIRCVSVRIEFTQCCRKGWKVMRNSWFVCMYENRWISDADALLLTSLYRHEYVSSCMQLATHDGWRDVFRLNSASTVERARRKLLFFLFFCCWFLLPKKRKILCGCYWYVYGELIAAGFITVRNSAAFQ